MNLGNLRRAFWKGFLAFGIVAVVISLIVNGMNPSNDLTQTVIQLGFFVGAITSIVGVWGAVDRSYTHKNRLIKQVRNQVPDVAKSAISELNAEGYLADGSLRGVDFRGAKLAGADLKATDKKGRDVPANLERVNLSNANLRGADLKGINLKGANLELTNFENAQLMEADLSNAKCHITNLVGANLYKAVLTGANFAGETCDNTTFLPDGKKWDEKRSWTEFGATEIIPEYATKKRVSLDEAKRKADVELLISLWQQVSSKQLRDFVDYIDSNYIPSYISDGIMINYLNNRDLPENHFNDLQLEDQFSKFDDALKVLRKQIGQHSSSRLINGMSVIVSHYKLSDEGPRIPTQEIILYKLQEWEKAIDMANAAVKLHNELVKTIKDTYPEFHLK